MIDQKVSIDSRSIKGKLDNQPYNVITLIGAGRGWFQSMYFATSNPHQLKGIIKEELTFQGKGYVYVKLDDEALKSVVRYFAKSPYIKKDGSVTEGHVRGESMFIEEVYGCCHGVILFNKKDVKKVAS